MVAITVLVVTDIFSREVLSVSIVWAQKAALYLMIWAGFIGSGLATSKGAHLRPEIGDKLWPSKFQATFHRIRHFVTAIFCSFACYYGIGYLSESYEMGDTNPVLMLPMWIAQTVIPVTFFLNAFKNFIFAFFPSTMPSVVREPT
ncbi:MAG: TRAP transporter small permease [Bdellovibrio sp.]|nr:TRAP transporter small permease [Bdellovibrio sp.]